MNIAPVLVVVNAFVAQFSGSYSEEFYISEQGRLEHRVTWDITSDVEREDDDKQAIELIEEQLVTTRRCGTAEVFPGDKIVEKHDGMTRYQWIVYCTDVNQYDYIGDDAPDFDFKATESGFDLRLMFSHSEQLNVPVATTKEVFSLPGNIVSATGCNKVDGRVARLVCNGPDDWQPESPARKLSRVSPRLIVCGKSKIPEKERDAFLKRFGEARQRSKFARGDQ